MFASVCDPGGTHILPAADTAPARTSRLLLSWRLWLALLLTSLCLIAFALCMPAYRRMQAFDYLDAHEIEYELTDDNEWMTERFGRWGRGFRRVRSIQANRIANETDVAHIAEFQEVREFVCWGSPPLSETSVDDLTSLRHLERIQLGHTSFTDEILTKWFSRNASLREVILVRTAASHRTLQQLSRIPTLNSLFLFGTTITDADFSKLEPFPNLQYFCMTEGAIGSEGGKWISKTPSLRYLSFDRTQVAADFWERIGRASRITGIIFENCEVSAEALGHMSSMLFVRQLRLDGSALDEGGLWHIGNMRQLQKLSLEACVGITDAGILHLSGLTSLETLKLEHCEGLTDACVRHLEGMASLNYLSLPSGAINRLSIEPEEQ